MPAKTGRVWFITGASSGFGREFVSAAAGRGDCIVATARRPEALEELASSVPGRVKTIRLDVTDRSQIDAAVAEAIETFGHIDVVVNNAGYGLLGAIEEASDEQIRRLFETNVFGALNVTRAVLSQLRRQRSGHLIQISSVGGQVGSAGFGFYQSTKFALEGFSEALAEEVRPLGIKVTIVEPGAFRTDFLGRSIDRAEPIADYEGTVGAARASAAARNGQQPGDPVRAARAILEAVDAEEPPLRLPLGADALERIRAKIKRQLAELEHWEETIVGTESVAAY